MSDSKLIELGYFDPKVQVRLTAYADTIIMERTPTGGTISALRFGGYSEAVRALSDAIYGGASVEARRSGQTLLLDSVPKGYRRQFSHDGVYAIATLMANDDVQEADAQEKTEEKQEGQEPETPQPRKCYIFCPAGDRAKLFEELDRKTAAPLIPEFQDYVLTALIDRGDLRKLAT